MVQENVPDLLITGVSGAAGGTYNNVSLEGVSKVNGPVVARVFQGNGLMKVYGSLKVEEMEANGILKVKGSLQAGSMKYDGMLTVEGGLRGESCVLNGMIHIKGDCELEVFTGEGTFNVDGLLSAGHMNFSLQGQAKANEIGAESLVIRQVGSGVWGRLVGGIIPKFRTELQARSIEGDFIDLECTTAEVVRGNVVIIGQGCSIGRVEYREGLTVHPEARVGKEEKSGE